MTDRSVPRHRITRRSPRHAQPWPLHQHRRRPDPVGTVLAALGFGAGATLLAFAVLLLVLPAVTR